MQHQNDLGHRLRLEMCQFMDQKQEDGSHNEDLQNDMLDLHFAS